MRSGQVRAVGDGRVVTANTSAVTVALPWLSAVCRRRRVSIGTVNGVREYRQVPARVSFSYPQLVEYDYRPASRWRRGRLRLVAAGTGDPWVMIGRFARPFVIRFAVGYDHRTQAAFAALVTMIESRCAELGGGGVDPEAVAARHLAGAMYGRPNKLRSML